MIEDQNYNLVYLIF